MSSPADNGIKGRHAVITGGGRGIGAAIAEALAARGAKITLVGRTAAALDDVAGGLRNKFKTKTYTAACDVSEADGVARAFGGAVDHLGGVHILVNNAGQSHAAAFDATSLDDWNRMLAVNLTGTFLCTQQVLPAMIAAGAGRIINIASTAGIKGYAKVAAYCAAKHGVVGLTRALAAETARTGVTVNAVCPGYTEGTEMFATAVANVMRSRGVSAEDARALLTRHSPRGTLITPQEVADAAVWLCSGGASAITGQAIAVAAGEVMG